MNSYKRLCTQFYDLDKPHAPPEALAFYLRYAEQATGPILEPMCGSGRYLLPMLELGLPIEGVDASPDMLHACRENGRRRGLAPVLFEQFLDRLDLPRRYHLVLIPAGSFGLITEPDEVRESLRRLHSHMVPGAVLLLQVERPLPEAEQPETWRGRWVTRPDGAKIVISQLSRYSAAGSVLRSVHRYELIKDGRLLEVECEELDERLYEPEEFRALLEASGFTAIQYSTGSVLDASDDSDDSLVFSCVRP
jgi:SAM-dependent methyltransferase